MNSALNYYYFNPSILILIIINSFFKAFFFSILIAISNCLLRYIHYIILSKAF